MQQIAQKLSEERKKNYDEKVNLEQKIRELELKLEKEEKNLADLQQKYDMLRTVTLPVHPVPGMEPLEELEVSFFVLSAFQLLFSICSSIGDS